MTAPWEKRLMRLYGLKEGEYAERLRAQGGVCALCGRKPGRTRLAVDHDHATGAVRGLLHPRCNRALGPLEHSEEVLTRVIAYLERALAMRRGQ